MPARYLDQATPGAVWRRATRRRFDTMPRRHHEVVALHALAGTMRYLIDGRILTVGPRTVLWAFSDQTHMLLAESADFDMWVVVLSRELIAPPGPVPPTVSAGLPHGAFTLAPDDHAELAAIAAGAVADDTLSWRSAGLRWWAMRAWNLCRGAAPAVGAQTHPAVQRAIEAIEAEPAQPLAAIAATAGLGLPRLTQVFRKEIGETPAHYRTRCRLRRVDQTMADTGAPGLLTAALDAGFGSYAQFYRTFVAARGMGPRAYYRRS